MNTPSRRSSRLRQSIHYEETLETNDQKSVKISQPKTPKSASKSKIQKEPATSAITKSLEKNSPSSSTSSSSSATKAKNRRVSRSRKFSENDNVSPKKLRTARTPSAQALESLVSEASPTVDEITNTTHAIRTRRSSRDHAPVQRYSDINLKINLKENTVKRSKMFVLDQGDISSDDEVEEDKENLLKPMTLFVENEDIEGQTLFEFRTPKKKDGMASLATNTPKAPRNAVAMPNTPQTPKNGRLSVLLKTPTSRPSASKYAKTPRHVRDKIKQNLHKVKQREINSSDDDLDFSSNDDDLDFTHKNSSESSSESSEESDDTEYKKLPPMNNNSKKQVNSYSPRKSQRHKSCDVQFVLQSDNFFASQLTKSKTSDHTLDRLKNLRLQNDDLQRLLTTMKLPVVHENIIKEIHEDFTSYFDKWLLAMDEGFTIILYGLGSKRNLLQSFHKERLKNEHVVVVNGFFPSITLKDILDGICCILEMQSCTGNANETAKLIENELSEMPTLNIFMIIHNLDGTMLRNDKCQSILSRLASIPRLHLIASIDHFNAPLMWNNTKLSQFNFLWWDTTTMLPYIDETVNENSIMVQNSGAMELSSMKSVFLSLTKNARGIYILVVQHQLNHDGDPNYQGISFKKLYSSCREKFLVSSDIALRAQLTEFFDHKLAKMKRAVDGTENVTIPIKNSLLQQFLNENCE